MSLKHPQIANSLRAITAQMQTQGLWQDSPPAAEKLASSLPFCVDTLTFSQWLQWVMFPKLVAIIETESQLPGESNMAVMAEQAFKREALNTDKLLSLICQLDTDLNA